MEQLTLAEAVLLRLLAQFVGQLRREGSELRNMLEEHVHERGKGGEAKPHAGKVIFYPTLLISSKNKQRFQYLSTVDTQYYYSSATPQSNS